MSDKVRAMTQADGAGEEDEVYAGGRGKGRSAETTDLALLARRFTKKAVKTLADIMQDPTAPHNARIAASREILNRGHGQAPTHVEIVKNLTDDELEQMSQVILERRQKVLAQKKDKARLIAEQNFRPKIPVKSLPVPDDVLLP